MAAHSSPGIRDTDAQAVRAAERVEQKARPGIFQRCQPMLPVITTLVGVVTCVATIMIETRSTRGTVRDAQAQLALTQQQMLSNQQEALRTDWRDALQKVGFDEANLVPTAFLMESFNDDPEHRPQARKIEYTVLERTNQPDFFDLIYWDLVPNLDSAGELNDMAEIGRSLNQRLRSLWQAAPEGHGKSYAVFLQHPEQFYPPKTQQAKLQSVLVLMWELDSFSAGFGCVLNANESDCPHFPQNELRLGDLMLVNQTVPALGTGQGAITSATTCDVGRDDAQGGFACSAAAGASQ